jgi:DNA-binding LacI/PurR family transcriptional regulator
LPEKAFAYVVASECSITVSYNVRLDRPVGSAVLYTILKAVRSDSRMGANKNGTAKQRHPVTLQMVAERVGLTKGTCSAVLNKSAASRSVPPHTQERILQAARELNYRPSFYARNLRVKHTYMIGVITQEIGDFYGSPIISGIERYLRQKNYFFLTVAVRDDPKLLETYSHLLLDRGVEGLITVDTVIDRPLPLPAIAIPGHHRVEGVTNIVLDHRKAARLALNHLIELDHREIAFMKGPDESPDAKDRWKAIRQVVKELGIPMRAELIVQLEGRDATPQLGYPFAKQLLSRGRPFTALFAYNDVAAIGAIHALQEAGLRVPKDVSVVGFDDIRIAVHNNPSLTTVRQPLQRMGEIAASTLLKRIEHHEVSAEVIEVAPEFVIRDSTTRARTLTVAGFRKADAEDIMVQN